MKLKLYKIFIFLFILGNVLDYITTILATSKHGIEYESNPVYILTGNIWVLYIVKLILVSVLVLSITKYYSRNKSPHSRYFIVYIIVFLTPLLFGVAVNNYAIYNLDTEIIPPPPPDDVKLEMYKEILISDRSVEIVTQDKMSVIPYFIILNQIQFLIWRSFEKWKMNN